MQTCFAHVENMTHGMNSVGCQLSEESESETKTNVTIVTLNSTRKKHTQQSEIEF